MKDKYESLISMLEKEIGEHSHKMDGGAKMNPQSAQALDNVVSALFFTKALCILDEIEDEGFSDFLHKLMSHGKEDGKIGFHTGGSKKGRHGGGRHEEDEEEARGDHEWPEAPAARRRRYPHADAMDDDGDMDGTPEARRSRRTGRYIKGEMEHESPGYEDAAPGVIKPGMARR